MGWEGARSSWEFPAPPQKKHLWGHPRPPLKSFLCSAPGCLPISTTWHWGKGGKRCQMLKNETPGLDPSSNPSPRHSMGEERSPPTRMSLSLYSRCFSESPRGPDLELCDLANPGNEDLLQVFPGLPGQCPASSRVGLMEDGAGMKSQEVSLCRSP